MNISLTSSDGRVRLVPPRLRGILGVQTPVSTEALVTDRRCAFSTNPLALHPALASAIFGVFERAGNERRERLDELHRLLSPFDGQTRRLGAHEATNLADWAAFRVRAFAPTSLSLLFDLLGERVGKQDGQLSPGDTKRLETAARQAEHLQVEAPKIFALRAGVAAALGDWPFCLNRTVGYAAETLAFAEEWAALELLLLDVAEACSPYFLEGTKSPRLAHAVFQAL
jgi:hypothetical protein